MCKFLSTAIIFFLVPHFLSSQTLDWVKTFGGLADDQTNASCVDSYSNIYVGGWFTDSADFDPDNMDQYMVIGKSGRDAFVQKLNADGQLKWVYSFSGSHDDAIYSITTDMYGNVYAMGIFEDTIDFDPGLSNFNLIASGYRNVFILKLDSIGNFIWAKNIGGSEFVEGLDIEISTKGSIYCTGWFTDSVDFDPSSGVFSQISKGDRDAFLLKLESNGNFSWVNVYGGIGWDIASCISINSNHDVYLAGSFFDSVQFNSMTTQIANGGTDVFIEKLDSNGQ